MMLSSAGPVFGGRLTTGGWVDLIPPDDASIDVWREAFKLAYVGTIDGRSTTSPGALGSALAIRYFKDVDLGPAELNALQPIGYSVATISTAQSIENVLNGLEWGYNNLDNVIWSGLSSQDFNASVTEFINQAVIMSQKPPMYPIRVNVFGTGSENDFVIHDAPKPATVKVLSYQPPMTQPIVRRPLNSGNAPSNSSYAPVIEQPQSSPLKIATIVAAIASFLL